MQHNRGPIMFRLSRNRSRQVSAMAGALIAMTVLVAGSGGAFAFPGIGGLPFNIAGGSGNGTGASSLAPPEGPAGIKFKDKSTAIEQSPSPITGSVLEVNTYSGAPNSGQTTMVNKALGLSSSSQKDSPTALNSDREINQPISVSDPVTSLVSAANLDSVAISTSDLFNSATFQSIAATAFTDSGAYAALAGTIDLSGKVNQSLADEYNRIMTDCEKGGGRGSEFCEGLLGCVAKLAKSATSITEARMQCISNQSVAKISDSADATQAEDNGGGTTGGVGGVGVGGVGGIGGSGGTGKPVLLSSILFDTVKGGSNAGQGDQNIDSARDEFVRLFGDVEFLQKEEGNAGTLVTISSRHIEPVIDGQVDCEKPVTLNVAAWCYGGYVFDLLRWAGTAQCVYFNENAIEDLTSFDPMKPRGSQVNQGGNNNSWGDASQLDEYGPFGTSLPNWTRAVSDLSFPNFTFNKTLAEAFFWQFKKATFRAGNGLIQQIGNFTSGNMLTGAVKLDCAPLADSASKGLSFGSIYCRKNKDDPICAAGGGGGNSSGRIPMWAEMMYTYSLARAYLHKRQLAEQGIEILNRLSGRLDLVKTKRAYDLIKKQWQDADGARLTTYLGEVSKVLTIMYEEYQAARNNKGGGTAGGAKRGGSKGGFSG